MKLTTEEKKELDRLSLALMYFLQRHAHPHTYIVVDSEQYNVLETLIGNKKLQIIA